MFPTTNTPTETDSVHEGEQQLCPWANLVPGPVMRRKNQEEDAAPRGHYQCCPHRQPYDMRRKTHPSLFSRRYIDVFRIKILIQVENALLVAGVTQW